MNPIDLYRYVTIDSPQTFLDQKSPKRIESKTTEQSDKANDIGKENFKFNNAAKNESSLGSWLTGKIVGKIAFLGSGLSQKNQDSKLKLIELSGGPEFGQILSILAYHPQMISLIKDAIGGFSGNAIVNMGSLPTVLETIFFQVVVNISKEMILNTKYKHVEVTPTNVISFLFKKIVDDLNSISAKLEEIKNTHEHTVSEQDLLILLKNQKKEMIRALREDLLNLFFPHGIDDFPMPPLLRAVYGLRSYLWNYVKTKVESLLYDLDDLKKLNNITSPVAFESIKIDSQRLAQASIQIIQEYLKTDNEFVVKTIIGNSPVLAGVDEIGRQNLTDYFSTQIQKFSKSENSGIHHAWALLEFTLESFMTLIITNLSKDKKPDESTSVMLVSKVLKTLSDFVKEHKNSIDSSIKELSKNKKSPADIKKDPYYIRNFFPLAKSYREMTGLTELPELLKGLFDALFIGKIPQLLAQNYDEVILPLVELFEAIDGSKSSQEPKLDYQKNQGLLAFCDMVGKSVASKAPSWIEGQSKNIADNIASNIPKASLEIKEWISDWLNGKLIELVNQKNEKLWNFVECAVPNVLAHIIISLSHGKTDQNDLIFNSINTVLERFNRFAIEQGQTLDHSKNNRSELITIFSPFCEKLMEEFGIGNGKKLPVPQLLNTAAEEQLKKILPELFSQLYLDFYAMSKKAATIDQFKQEEANDGLIKFTEIMARLVTTWTPKLLEKNSAILAENIVEVASTIDNGSSFEAFQQKELFKNWLRGQFAAIGPNLSHEYPGIWALLGQNVNNILIHIFFNISKGNTAKTEASLYGITKILELCHAFITENHRYILETYEELKTKNVQDPFSNERVIQIFIPLAVNLQDTLGLSEFEGVFKELFKTLFTKFTPALLAKSYLTMLIPLNDLYRAISKPKSLEYRNKLEKLPGGTKLASWCKIAGEYIGEGIPKSFQDSELCIELSNKIALFIIMLIANPEQKKLLEKQSLSNASLNVPEELLDLYNWACKWFEIQIKRCTNSDDPKFRKLWDFARFSVDDLLAHILLNLVGKNKHGKDALFVALNKILKSYSLFHHKHAEKIALAYQGLQQKNNTLLVHQQQNPAHNKEFAALFLPLFQSIMHKAGIQKGSSLPLPEILVTFGEEQLEKFVPQLFAELYCNFTSSEKVANEKIKFLENIQRIVNPQNLDETTPQGESVKAIESLSLFCAFQMVKLIQDVNISIIDPNTKLKKISRLDQQVSHINDPQIQGIWDGIQESISLIILQLFANHFEGLNASGRSIDHTLVNDLINKFLMNLFIYSPEEEVAIEAVLEIPTPALRKKALKEVFAQRVSSLFSIFNPTQAQKEAILASLPLPSAIAELLWNQLETSMLPEFLANIYQEKVKGIKQSIVQTDEMERITGTKMRSEVCEIIADFAGQFIPAYTGLEHQMIAEDIYDIVSSKLAASGQSSDAKEVESYLKKNKEILLKEIGEAMLKTALTLDRLQPITRDYIKIVLVQAFSGVTKRIDSFENSFSENYDKDFLLKQGIGFMKLIKEHLQALNNIAEEQNVNVFHKVDHDILINALSYSKKLHTGIPQSKEALNARRQIKEAKASLKSARLRVDTLRKFGILASNSVQRLNFQIKELCRTIHRAEKIVNHERLTNFFLPVSKQLLEISGMTGADSLPFPSPLKELIWDQLQNQVIPNVLLNIFQEILDPQSLNQMIITALEDYNGSMNYGNTNIVSPIPKDLLQQELNTLCGELIQQVVKMMPNSMAKKALWFDKIKNISGEKLGESLRAQLSEKLSLQKIIDKGLPSVEKNLNSENIAKDSAASEAAVLQKMRAGEESMRIVKKEMQATAHKEISKLITGSFTQICDKFFSFWNNAIRKVFGKYTDSVLTFSNFIGFRILYGLIKWTLIIASTPLVLVGLVARKIFWSLVDRHLSHQVKHALDCVHNPIHEDLIYKLTEKLLKSLSAAKTGP